MSGETKPYRPSNGTEGDFFEADFCRKCEYEARARLRDADSGCKILTFVLALDIDHPRYPKEWVMDPDGSNPRCTKFRKAGTGTWEKAAADLARYEAAMAELRASRR